MKKLLLLLFSLMLSFNSYGETIICLGEIEASGSMTEITDVFKRDGDKFISYLDKTLDYEEYTLDISYESTSQLLLQWTSGTGSLAAVSIDKLTKDYTQINLPSPNILYVSSGKCEFYEEYKLLN